MMRRLLCFLPCFLSVLLAAGFLEASPLLAEASPQAPQVPFFPHFSWSTWTAFTAGEVREVLYVDSSSTTVLSELYWPVPFSVGLGGSLKVLWVPWLDSQVKVEGFVPLFTGIMTDRDWNAYSSPGGYYFNAISQTQATLLSHYRLEADVGVPFAVQDWHFRGSAGVAYRQFSWEAWGPATQYTTDLSNNQVYQTAIEGLGITYRLQEILPYVGFQVEKPLGPVLSTLECSVGIWPVYEDQDLHYLTSQTYQDTPMGGLWLRSSAQARWDLGLGLLGLKLTYELSRFSRGGIVNYAINSSIANTYANQAGSESDLWSLDVSFSSE
jgi:outer membrane protease